MIPYKVPTKDMQFILKEMGLMDTLQSMPDCADATPDLVDAILEEAAKLLLLLLVVWRFKAFNEPVDGIVIADMKTPQQAYQEAVALVGAGRVFHPTILGIDVSQRGDAE